MTTAHPFPTLRQDTVADSQWCTKVAIIGTGLIGSSIAHAMRQSGVCGTVVAYDIHSQHAQQALALELVDAVAPTLQEALQGADLVLLAVPVLRTAALLPGIVEHLSDRALLVDAGSAKTLFARECEALPIDIARRTLPCHPIAGHITSGPSQAHAQLMQGRLMVMTPLTATTPDVQERMTQLWRSVGFQVMTMTPTEHDEVYAQLSHMPHVASFALMHYLSASPRAATLLAQLGGNAIKDMTRHAASNPQMWSDIFTANRESILQALHGYRLSLDMLEHTIRESPVQTLENLLLTIQASYPPQWSNP